MEKDIGLLKEVYDLSVPCIELELSPVKPDRLRSFDSKIGGLPYIPVGKEYPIGKDGKPLNCLAQINLGDMPVLEGFPKKGLLQFFMDFEDDLFGVDNKSFLVQYIECPSEGYIRARDLSSLELDETYSPISGTLKVVGKERLQPPTIEYVELLRMFSEYYGDLYDDPNFNDYYSIIDCGSGFQIGGYPMCCQDLPEFLRKDDYVVLLQLGYSDHVCFGDCGIANFFVKKSELERLDFSNAQFYWDCY